MTALARRWYLAGLLLAVALSIGCNPFLSLFFLLPSEEPKLPAKHRLASEDKHKVVKVVIVASNPGETRVEFMRLDKDISTGLSRKLQEGCKANNENVIVVASHKVANYMDNNAAWGAEGPLAIGKHFAADYVIDLEVGKFRMADPKSKQFYSGHAEISVKVLDVNQPEEGVVFSEEVTVDYPSERMVPIDSTTADKFKQDFLNRIATDISWLFTAHLVADHHHCE